MRVLLGFVLALVLMPILGLCALNAGMFPIQATAKPPQWERRIAMMGFDKSVDKEAQGLTSPIAGNEDDIIRGMKVYRDDCAGCHGDRGKTSRWGRENFYPPAPGLARHAMDDPVPNIFAIIKYGVRYTGMAGWKNMIPEEDMWRIAYFLHNEDKLPPRADSLWKAGPPPETAAAN
jgi:mono/diheme cytochrome c family protein